MRVGGWGIDPGWGVAAVRVGLAIVMIHAGWNKWFKLGVFTGVTTNMAKYGFPMPEAFALVAATLELVGGALLLVGLFGRSLGFLLTVQFAIALFYVKLRLMTFAEGRLDVMILAAAILIMLAGSGRASIDERR